MIPNTFKGMIRDGSRAAEVLKDVNDDQFVPFDGVNGVFFRGCTYGSLLCREIPFQL